MPKAVSEKKYSTFVKGLITEANALTFPENASLDEDNFDLLIDGSRQRRLGVDYEPGYSLKDSGIALPILEGTRKSFHRWDFPGGATDVAIGVIRVADRLWFINILAAAPSASFLNGGNPLILGFSDDDIDVAVINNMLIIGGKGTAVLTALEYDKDTQLVSYSFFPIQVRDFWGVSDFLNTSERPTLLDDKHLYNLINQGWSDTITSTCSAGQATTTYNKNVWFLNSSGQWQLETPTSGTTQPSAVTCTFTKIGVYPSNTDLWTLGKIGSSSSADFEKFSPESLSKNSVDNAEAPKGSFVIDAFTRGYSRYLATGLAALPQDQEKGRISCVAAYAGRVWYSGVTSSVLGPDAKSPNYSGFVFFSQVITAKDKLGKCYQDADPTSPTIPDIVDTDGGAVQLPQVTKIVKLVPVGDSLLIFAENGVWEIFGDTGGFKATNYQTACISSVGAANPKAIVVAGNLVVYWARDGIFMLSPDQATGRYTGQSMSISTIQTYYNSIPAIAKDNARGFFDARDNHIRWIYNDTPDYSELVNVNHYNRQLNLDMTLKAFYKFSFSPSPAGANAPHICDFIDMPSYSLTNATIDVYVGNNAVLSVADQVIINAETPTARVEKYRYLTFSGASFTVSLLNNLSFLDWVTADGAGVDAPAYLITGYETFGDLMRTKQVPYIFFYLKRTETGFHPDGLGNLLASSPSSCKVQAQWNWTNSASSGKWGTAFQAYRYIRNYTPADLSDTYDTGDSLIVTKSKLRGSGKAISLKITTEYGKDLQLLGWAIPITGDGTP